MFSIFNGGKKAIAVNRIHLQSSSMQYLISWRSSRMRSPSLPSTVSFAVALIDFTGLVAVQVNVPSFKSLVEFIVKVPVLLSSWLFLGN